MGTRGPSTGQGGRPPKPIELKRRIGNPGGRALPDERTTVAIMPAEGSPTPVTLGQIGRETWRSVNEAPWVGRLDLHAVETFCALRDDEAEMRRRIESEGLTLNEPIVTPAGMVVGERMVPHPLLKELRAVEKQLRDFASALGFDPTARSRLGLAEVKTRSKLEELLAQRQHIS